MFPEQETKQAGQPKEIEIMSRSTSKSEISTFAFKQEEIHVEERSSTVLTFRAQKDETHQAGEISRPEKPSKLDINVVNSPASASQPSSSTASSQIPDSQSMAELSKHQQSSQVEFNMVLCEPAEFVKCIEKLIQSTQTVEKHLDNIQKPNKEFYEFEKQEIKLNAIKQTLESLAMALRTSLIHKRAILDKSNRETSKNITSSIQTLTRQHQNVVQKYKEKNSLHIQNYDKWHDFNKNFLKIQSWIDSTLVKLNELNETTLDTDKVQEIIKVNNPTRNRLFEKYNNKKPLKVPKKILFPPPSDLLKLNFFFNCNLLLFAFQILNETQDALISIATLLFASQCKCFNYRRENFDEIF